MIVFNDLALRRGERLLLSEASLSLHAGWRVGVVGRNGAGKSSLFAAIGGELEPDRGAIGLPGRLRIASVAQETPALAEPAIEFVLAGDAELAGALRAEQEAIARQDWAAVAAAHHRIEETNGYDARARAGRLLHGLGFAADTHDRPLSAFSGGWRGRLNLARALMTPSDLLLLDEPTNHLDLDAVLWLEQWLLKYPGTLLLISHDREFLDGVCTHVLHLHAGRARLYSGDYTGFEHQRAEQLHQQQAAFEKEQAEREHLQGFIDRFRAKASKARQAQSRLKRLAKLAGTEAVRAECALHLAFPEPARLPHSLLRLSAVAAGYRTGAGAAAGETRVLQGVDFRLEAGDRIGLLGPNGAGKSTLVKTLVGELQPLAGERSAHPDLNLGYFAQHTLDSLREGASPIDHLRALAPEAPIQALRDFLGRWQFAGNRAFDPVEAFSGGERARLALALIAWRKPNALLLDEPTNHLDLEMREALAEALSDFPGAIVLVSHDRHLIGLVCERFWRVAGGRVQAFDGDLDAYAEWLRTRPEPARSAAPGPAAPLRPAAPAKTSAGAARRQRERMQRIEARIGEIEAESAALAERLSDPALYGNQGSDEVARLGRRQTELACEHQALEGEWMGLYATLEGAV